MQIFSREAFDFKKQVRDLSKVQNIAICGLFIALYIVLSYFNIKITENIEIRFAYLILAIAGFYGGPIMGLTVGVASDILSMLMTAGQGSAFFFGFTVSYGLVGFLFGTVLYKKKITPLRMIPAALSHYLVGLTLSTYWLYMMYGTPFKVLFMTRFVKNTLMLPIDMIMLYIVLKAFSQIVVHAGIAQKQKA